METGAASLLECRHVSRSFGAVAAVAGIDLSVHAGETLGVAGANGAGKSTLFNLIGGQHRLDGGQILFAGARIDGLPPHRVCMRGISRTFQSISNASTLTVLENVALASSYNRRRALPPVRFSRDALDNALDAIAFVGLAGDERRLAGTLSVYGQKKLMIAAALASSPRLLLLDEPVGGLAPGEIDECTELVGLIQARGVTLLVIEHLMSFLVRVAPQRILVMHEGQRLFEGSADEVRSNELVRRVWLGSGESSTGVGSTRSER
jgi:ABC-type branched-subunit amino acid transport system ATPase component